MSSWAVSIGTASVVVAEGIVVLYAEEVDNNVLVYKTWIQLTPLCKPNFESDVVNP